MSNAAIIARLGLDSGDFRKGLEQTRKELAKVKTDAADARSKSVTAAAAKAEADFAEKQRKSAEAIKARAVEERKANDVRKQAMEAQRGAILGAAGNFAGSLGVTLSVGGAIAAGRAIIDFGSNLADASEALGINVEAMQELHYAFGQSGADAETVNKGIKSLSENLTAARGGNEKTIASFAALGVTWAELNTLTPDEVIMKIAASSDAAMPPAERLSLIIDVMGRSGLKMAAGLNSGSDALARMRAETIKLSKEEVAALDEAGDALSRLKNKALVLAAKEVVNLKRQGPLALLPASATSVAVGLAARRRAPDFGPGYKPTLNAAGAGELAQDEPAVPESPEVKARREGEEKLDEQLATTRKRELQKQVEEGNALFLKDAEKKKAAREAAAKAQADLEEKLALDRREQLKEEVEKGNALYLKSIEEKKKAEKELKDDKAKWAKEAAEHEHEMRKKFIDDEAKRREEKLGSKIEDISDPQGRAGRRRAGRKEESLSRRAQREIELAERGGLSKADAEKDTRPLAERVKARGTARGSLDPRENRAADLRNGLAAGRKSGAGEDLKGALDSSTMAGDIAEIRKNLQPAKL